jgi:hypothetical protein
MPLTERQRQMHERINARAEAANPQPPMAEGEMVDVGGFYIYVPAGFVVVTRESDGWREVSLEKATRH